MLQYLKLISLSIITIFSALAMWAYEHYPESIGERARYEMMIEMPKAYASGILIIARVGESTIDASWVNEFGLSLLDFSYDEKKNKVKLHHVMKKLDKWYIKRVLKADLKKVMSMMMNHACTEFYNTKYKIKYIVNSLNEVVE